MLDCEPPQIATAPIRQNNAEQPLPKLSNVADQGERGCITVMFGDLVRLTALSERPDPVNM
jgi:hypothetical protein